MKKPTLFLASSSPRRKELLTAMGFSLKIVHPDSPEIQRPNETATAMVKRLAFEKLMSAMKKTPKQGNHLLLSADTVVVSPNGKEILGKPKSKKDALRMIRILSGKWHVVVTGYCIAQVEGNTGEVSLMVRRECKTRVKIVKLSHAQQKRYIQKEKPFDKAGSYAAQGFGGGIIEEIRGSYTNVVGLPLGQVCQDLKVFFGRDILQ